MRFVVTFCQFLELLGLSVWFGGMLIIGALVAPSAFGNLPIESAGSLMARIFHLFNQKMTLLVVVVLAASFLIRLWGESTKREPAGRRLRRWEGGLLLLFCLIGIYAGGVLTPRIEAARARLHAPGPEGTSESFGRLHRQSEELAGAGMVVVLGLFYLKARSLSAPGSREERSHG